MATIELRDLNPAEFNNNLIVYGKVAIGTSDLAYNGLQIKPSSGNGQLVVERASGASYQINAQASLVQIGTISNSPLQLMTNSNAYVHIDTSGRVGVGTTSPQNELHVSGTSTMLQLQSSTTTAKIQFNNSGGNACFIGSNNDKLIFQTNSTNRVTITNGGDVGIGTTTPDVKLHIQAKKSTSGL